MLGTPKKSGRQATLGISIRQKAAITKPVTTPENLSEPASRHRS